MADSNGLSEFPIENIPNEHLLYLRVHWRHVEEGQLNPVAFQDKKPPDGRRAGLSTDWCRYATPEQTQAGGRQPAENYGVVKLVVGTIRGINGLTVEHAPIKDHPELPDNRAHTEVYGDKRDPEIRVNLLRAWRWVIEVAPP